MNIRTTAIAAGVAALLGAGAALAQPAPQGAPGQGYQGMPQGGEQGAARPHRQHHQGMKTILKEEVNAGRMSEKEYTLLVQKIRALHAQKRAEREAGSGATPPQGQMPPSH